MNEALQYFFMSWVDPKLVFLAAAGTFAGIYIGAIPGLSVTMAVSILISFTFKWHVNEALVLIVGIYLGGVYGGSRSAILLNIPGAPAAIATGLDGYPLAKRGEAGTAIGLTTVMSVIGGFVGIAALAVAAPTVSSFALHFGPRDYLMLAIWGILLVGSLSGGSLVKGIFAGALGVLIASVGLDPLTAEKRFTFGSLQLTAGISYIAAMIGFFGVSEILAQLHELHLKGVKQDVSKIIPSWSMVRKYLPLSLRTSRLKAATSVRKSPTNRSALMLSRPSAALKLAAVTSTTPAACSDRSVLFQSASAVVTSLVWLALSLISMRSSLSLNSTLR